MIKYYCDVCGEETTNTEFVCNILTKEVVTNIVSEMPVPQKQAKEGAKLVCKSCYDKNIRNLFKTDDRKKDN